MNKADKVKHWSVGQVRALVYKLLDESKPKKDLTAKIPVYMDTAQAEISLYCPVYRTEEYEADDLLPGGCRRANRVLDEDGRPVDYRVAQLYDGQYLQAAKYPCVLEYEAVPERITDETPDDALLELPEKAALAMAYYVAAQCNSLEYDQRFFQSFFAQYQGKLQNLAAEVNGPAFAVVADEELPGWM